MDLGAPLLVERNLALDNAGPYDGVPPKEALDAFTRRISKQLVDKDEIGARVGKTDDQENTVEPEPAPAWQVINYGGAFGIFVFVPAIAETFDLSGLAAMRALFLACFVLTIAVYPLIFFRVTKSWAAALISPLALILGIRAANIAVDSYWAQAWAALALLPLVWLLHTRTRWG